MDQTTETADLTETENYLNTVLVDSGDESDGEEGAHDALLGGIRTGIKTITRTAREALSTCKNKTELDHAVKDIENSTLKLLKLEKSFMKTATIVSNVIDDLILDFDMDDDDPECFRLEMLQEEGNGLEELEKNGSGDASSATIKKEKEDPYLFLLSPTNMDSVAKFKDKLSEEMNKRMEAYKTGLTDSYLKSDEKFVALLDQVRLGRKDAESAKSFATEMEGDGNGKTSKESLEAMITQSASKSDSQSVASFLASIPYSAEELLNYKYTPYDEEADTDDSVLPSVDPITKELIMDPVKNKFCHHVFERDSIFGYIACHSDPRCPVHMCNNRAILEESHFIADPALTARIQRKNKF